MRATKDIKKGEMVMMIPQTACICKLGVEELKKWSYTDAEESESSDAILS